MATNKHLLGNCLNVIEQSIYSPSKYMFKKTIKVQFTDKESLRHQNEI